MTERITPEMLEAATHVAAWSGDWIHSDSLPEIYEAMRAVDPDFVGDEWEMERVLQEAAFVHGAQSCREMMARFVECESPTIANSIRLNWKPSWGDDPGPIPGSIPHNAFGETAETDALLAALAAGSRRAKTAKPVECEASQSGAKRNAQSQPLGNPLDTGDGK